MGFAAYGEKEEGLDSVGKAQRGGQESSRKDNGSWPRSSHSSLKLISFQGSRSQIWTAGLGVSAGI